MEEKTYSKSMLKKLGTELKKELLIVGIISVLCGVMMIAKPETVTKVICYVVGCVFLVVGLFNLIVIFVKKGAKPYVLRVIAAALAITIGGFFVIRASWIVNIIWVFMGVLIIMNAYFKFEYAYDLKHQEFNSWWYNLVFASLAIAGGIILLLINQLDITQIAKIRITGILLVIDGICDLASTWLYIANMIKFNKIVKTEIRREKMERKLSLKEKKRARKYLKDSNEVISVDDIVSVAYDENEETETKIENQEVSTNDAVSE
ncbi:MAG: DUF308 domain-containing protein [Lachnospiraceae bacterium]|nr:DUF308 domain-containing protein [Lachnospiraceae bacterium]